MGKNQTKWVNPTVLAEDEATHNGLQNLTDYAPNNPSYTVAALTHALGLRRDKEAAADKAAAAAATARDEAVSEQWNYHNLILGAKDQVRAQYGKDSTQVQELGLKRKSEYKKPTRKSKTKAG
jgi:hypothetical protein